MAVPPHPFVIAIPSYKRAEVLKQKTLKTLREGGVPDKLITIFVANEAERDVYRSVIPGADIRLGTCGLSAQRQFICSQYAEGTKILFLDDDIDSFKELVDGKLVKMNNLMPFFTSAFDKMEEVGSRIFGIYPAASSLYMRSQPEITTGLCYIIGAAYGIINKDVPVLEFGQNQEDKERTLLYWKADRKLLRFNHVTICTKYYAAGGMDSPTRKAETEESTKLLVGKYPYWIKRVYKPKHGIWDIRFVKQPVGNEFNDTAIARIPLRKGYTEAKATLLEELARNRVTKLPPPTAAHRRKEHGTRSDQIGSIGRSDTYGYGRTRNYGIAEFSANRKFPNLFRCLLNFARVVVPVGFKFTAITLNHGVLARKHRDSSNVGNSIIIGIGDYEGGELRIWDAEDETYADYDLKDAPTAFNGALLSHETQPFEGDRYTIIIYKQKWECDSLMGIPLVGADDSVTNSPTTE